MKRMFEVIVSEIESGEIHEIALMSHKEAMAVYRSYLNDGFYKVDMTAAWQTVTRY